MRRLMLFVLLAVTAFACDWDYPIWIPRTKSADPLYRFVKGDKAGYIDAKGNIVIPPTLQTFGNYGSEFHDGLLEISVSDGKYVDSTGNLVLDTGLYRGWDFSEGLAVAMREGENLWGYIDTTGKFAISPRFSTYPNGYVYPFSNGLAKIEVKGLFGFIDHSGTFVIPARLLDATSFSDDMARVVVEGPCVYFPEGGCGAANPVIPGVATGDQNKQSSVRPACKFSYIDKSGRVITEQRFDNARDFSEGLAPVQLGSRWGFIDKSGSFVIPPQFEDAQPFSSGLTRIRAKDKYGYADKTGRIVIEPQFDQAESFSEGFAVVGGRKDRYWYIDTHGRKSFDREFAIASPFFKGLAHVKPSHAADDFEYIDTTGSAVFRYSAHR